MHTMISFCRAATLLHWTRQLVDLGKVVGKYLLYPTAWVLCRVVSLVELAAPARRPTLPTPHEA
jgi:hypothetical protein